MVVCSCALSYAQSQDMEMNLRHTLICDRTFDKILRSKTRWQQEAVIQASTQCNGIFFSHIQLPTIFSAIVPSGYARAESGGEQRITKKRPFFGTVKEAESLCKVQRNTDKDTIRVEIDLADSGLEYMPGDALGIHASNAPQVGTPLLGKEAPTCCCDEHFIFGTLLIEARRLNLLDETTPLLLSPGLMGVLGIEQNVESACVLACLTIPWCPGGMCQR